jgi:ABC-type Fe3+/spermidine/putrescine transport system ATPase subunit
MLELDRLAVRHGDFEVCVDGLRLAATQQVTLVGPSGSGKSTLLRALVGLEPQAFVQGLRWQGEDIAQAPPHQRPFGWQPQELGLWPGLNALAHVAFARTRGRSARALEADRQVLRQVSLAHRAEAFPATLSGGEQQRLAFARVLAGRAAWAVLDEPYAHLDAVIAHDLSRAFSDLARHEGIGMIRVSHQVRAPRRDELFWVMEQGRLTQTGCWADLEDRPATPWIARFVALQS